MNGLILDDTGHAYRWMLNGETPLFTHPQLPFHTHTHSHSHTFHFLTRSHSFFETKSAYPLETCLRCYVLSIMGMNKSQDYCCGYVEFLQSWSRAHDTLHLPIWTGFHSY